MSQFSSPAAADPSAPLPTTSGLAIASLILGILGFLTGCIVIGGLFGVIGLILGIIALTQIGKPACPAKGKGLAITGMVLSCLSLAMAMVAPLMIGILLPALGSARHTARLMQTGTQLRGIHQACQIWASQNNDSFPPDLGTLAAAGLLTPEQFISPFESGDIVIPSDFSQWSDKDKIDWVNDNTSFAYIPGLTDNMDSTVVAAFEKLRYPPKKMICLVFNDNHVETMEVAEADQRIRNQTGRTLEDWSQDP